MPAVDDKCILPIMYVLSIMYVLPIMYMLPIMYVLSMINADKPVRWAINDYKRV